MDSSDSEHFESADEDFQSDEDEKVITKSRIQDEVDRNDKTITQNSIEILKPTDMRADSCQEKNSNKSCSSNEFNLNAKLKDMKIKTEDSVDQSNDNVSEDSSDKHSEDTHIVEVMPKTDKSGTTNKNRVRSKLGTKTTNVNASSKKEIETKPISDEKDVGKISRAVNLVEEENLWDDNELDWGAEEIEDKKTVTHSNPPVNITSKATNAESENWSSWSNWGVSVLSTATQSVSSLTSQITNVIETGLGAVDPEELVRMEREESKNLKPESVERKQTENIDQVENSYGSFGLGNLVKLVENTGTKVISGGLDTLETIGKKTMEVLQEGDPGLKKKRAFLKIDQDKPVLSQILREAKEKAENEKKIEGQLKKKWKNYETLFDDHQGLVHLEALELLSKQCEIKLKTIQSTMTGDEFTDFSETMDQIKELCELPDEDDDEQLSLAEIKERLENAVTEINIPIKYEKLLVNWEEKEIWLSAIDLDDCDEKEFHENAIETLAEMTSRAMEQFHKAGELLLVKERRSTADEADSLVQITATLISLIGIVAARFCERLNTKVANNKEVSGLITNIFFEAANSSSYIQDALQLLIPVLQVGAI